MTSKRMFFLERKKMIKPEQIPEKVRMAFEQAHFYGGNSVKESLAAAINSWPNFRFHPGGSICLPMPIPKDNDASEIERLQEQVLALQHIADRDEDEIERLRNQRKIVKYSMIIPEYELQNMNVVNVMEYEHHAKERMARDIAHELMRKGFVTFTKDKWKDCVTLTASLEVIQND